MFEVIASFVDLQDNNYKYSTGDKYPRDGYTPSEERITELSGSENRRKMPLIKAVQVQAKAESVDNPKSKKASKKSDAKEANEDIK